MTPTVRASIYDGVYEEIEAAIIRDTLSPSDRVLEIGCGAGFIATIASETVGDRVRGYDANPAMVAAAERTAERNGVVASFVNAVLQSEPVSEVVDFYVHAEFWTSSLAPVQGAVKIGVPLLDLAVEIKAHQASYLIVDIEGAENRPAPSAASRLRPQALCGKPSSGYHRDPNQCNARRVVESGLRARSWPDPAAGALPRALTLASSRRRRSFVRSEGLTVPTRGARRVSQGCCARWAGAR